MGVADRCNLGLIPSSEASWSVACRALRPTGGRLHLHGIANELKETHQQWSEGVRASLEELMSSTHSGQPYDCLLEHVERVKGYGPRLDHLVLDLYLRERSSE